MTIKEIFEHFEKIGTVVFATIDGDMPVTRMAHFRAYDDEGIYFQTMHTKPFYKQLKKTGKVSVCGLAANTEVEHKDDGEFGFEPGYAIRIMGEVKEVHIDTVREKAKTNPQFNHCIQDYEKYNAMVAFCITKAYGDVFDYDFEKKNRDHKLQRITFAYGGANEPILGLTIDKEKCISCGKCEKVCSFSAIHKSDDKYQIDRSRCDVCGDCYLECPVKAIG